MKNTIEQVYRVLHRLGLSLGEPVERSDLVFEDSRVNGDDFDVFQCIHDGAKQLGIFLRETQSTKPRDLLALVWEGVPIVVEDRDSQEMWILERSGRRVELTRFDNENETVLYRYGAVRRKLSRIQNIRVMVAKKELECDSLVTGSGYGPSHSDHTTPTKRFIALLRLDHRDIGTVAIFAFVSGILSLATPLAIESLVNVVSWGTYWQPLIVLALMLLACLGLSAVLSVLQTLVVEIIQRRQLVRFVGDLSHRFPRANQDSIAGKHPRELANRLFDIMTIQKATAILMFDGVALVLNTTLGLLLLAFYHPFLLGFDLVLLISMVGITWVLGRGGIRTAIDESISKYEIVHWLQDVLASPSAFKLNGGETLAVDRANRLASDYLIARTEQFRVVLRQIIFAVSIQVLASTALLGLGGWLVIHRELTLGQLVASELVVTVIVGAFAKAGKALEKYYDLMAGIDKVGHLLDIPVDPVHDFNFSLNKPASVRWDDLKFSGPNSRKIAGSSLPAGSRVAIVSDDLHARSLLARAIAGLVEPTEGVVEVAGHDAQHLSFGSDGKIIGYAGSPEVFYGSIRDNVALGRSIDRNRIREALQHAGLWDRVVRLPGGMETTLQSGGFPLTEDETIKLMIARAIAGVPRLLVVDGLLDRLSQSDRDHVLQYLLQDQSDWSLVLATSNEHVVQRCDDRVAVR